MRVAGVILAAGGSKRLGRPKQLLPFRGQPLLAATVANALASNLDEVLVVLGANAGPIESAIERSGLSIASWREAPEPIPRHPERSVSGVEGSPRESHRRHLDGPGQEDLDTLRSRARIVVNHQYEQGQSTSLQAGLRELDPAVDAVVFLLGDQPMVEAATINALIARFATDGSPIVQPSYNGKPGNPVLIAKELFRSIRRIAGDEGARSLLNAHPELIAQVRIAGDPPSDVDTEDDYQRLLDSDHPR